MELKFNEKGEISIVNATSNDLLKFVAFLQNNKDLPDSNMPNPDSHKNIDPIEPGYYGMKEICTKLNIPFNPLLFNYRHKGEIDSKKINGKTFYSLESARKVLINDKSSKKNNHGKKNNTLSEQQLKGSESDNTEFCSLSDFAKKYDLRKNIQNYLYLHICLEEVNHIKKSKGKGYYYDEKMLYDYIMRHYPQYIDPEKKPILEKPDGYYTNDELYELLGLSGTSTLNAFRVKLDYYKNDLKPIKYHGRLLYNKEIVKSVLWKINKTDDQYFSSKEITKLLNADETEIRNCLHYNKKNIRRKTINDIVCYNLLDVRKIIAKSAKKNVDKLNESSIDGFEPWKREIYNKITDHGLNVGKTLSIVYNYLNKTYGIVFEQLKKEFYKTYGFSSSANIALVYFLGTPEYKALYPGSNYRNLFVNVLNDYLVNGEL